MTDSYARELVAMMTEDDLTEHDSYIMEIFELTLDDYRKVKMKFLTWETLCMPSLYSHRELIERFVMEKIETENIFELARKLGRSTTFVKKIIKEHEIKYI